MPSLLDGSPDKYASAMWGEYDLIGHLALLLCGRGEGSQLYQAAAYEKRALDHLNSNRDEAHSADRDRGSMVNCAQLCSWRKWLERLKCVSGQVWTVSNR